MIHRNSSQRKSLTSIKVIKKNRKKRKCVFDPDVSQRFKKFRNFNLERKKGCFQCLEHNMLSGVENFNNIFANIAINNLYSKHPNYLKDFEQRAKGNNIK